MPSLGRSGHSWLATTLSCVSQPRAGPVSGVTGWGNGLVWKEADRRGAGLKFRANLAKIATPFLDILPILIIALFR